MRRSMRALMPALATGLLLAAGGARAACRADPAFLGSDGLGRFLAAGMPRWADAVRKSGAKQD